MNYEEKYKQALESIKELYSKGSRVVVSREEFENIFPELAESEDERIRKDIVIIIRKYISYVEKENCAPQAKDFLIKDAEEAIAWLEKQGEQKSNPCDGCINRKDCINCENGELRETEQKPINKVEPKFHKGDWVVNKFGDSWHIDSFDKKNYQVSDGKGNYNWFPISKQDEMHLWTIEDAKDGDVLVEDSCIFIVQKLGDNSTAAKTYCTLYDDGDFDDGSILYFDVDSTKPATKEQSDLLFQKMREAGYEWDAEKKELKIIDWSKHIKYEPNGPSIIEEEPVNWSEEDETYLDHVFTAVKAYYSDDKGHENPWREELLSWLKYIKDRVQPQNTWKPSDEQMDNLSRTFNGATYHVSLLRELYMDLKKLKGE